jgi:hypothetical protein
MKLTIAAIMLTLGHNAQAQGEYPRGVDLEVFSFKYITIKKGRPEPISREEAKWTLENTKRPVFDCTRTVIKND